jgi:putative thioredoxin
MSDSPTSSSFVIEATAKSLQQDVIERSHSVPIIIDFWAEWCGPCRMLGPVLEKLAGEYNGKFLLAKVNTDTESELAAQFGVRSIPAVFAVRGGKALVQNNCSNIHHSGRGSIV